MDVVKFSTTIAFSIDSPLCYLAWWQIACGSWKEPSYKGCSCDWLLRTFDFLRGTLFHSHQLFMKYFEYLCYSAYPFFLCLMKEIKKPCMSIRWPYLGCEPIQYRWRNDIEYIRRVLIYNLSSIYIITSSIPYGPTPQQRHCKFVIGETDKPMKFKFCLCKCYFTFCSKIKILFIFI